MAVSDNPGARFTPPAEPIYIGAGIEALIAVQLDAWERGHQAASEAVEPLSAIAQIAVAAERACEEALLRYIPLDEARFCDTYTLAWCAGYCWHARTARQRARQEKRIPTA